MPVIEEDAALKAADLRVELVPYEEALSRIAALSAGLNKPPDDAHELYPFLLARMLLQAQHVTLWCLNSKHLQCSVPWNGGWPSLPSAIVDAKKCGMLVADMPDEVKALLGSFAGWTVFADFTMRCCCNGKFSLVLRDVSLKIMVHNIAKLSAQGLKISQYIGVNSDDSKHLAHHYSGTSDLTYDPSCALRAVYIAESVIGLDGKIVSHTLKESHRLFNFPQFLAMVRECGDALSGISAQIVRK